NDLMTASNHQIVVIGAGISGLVCAHRLKSLGADVILIERSERAGGVIQSERIGEYLIERGPNSSRGTREVMDLVDELEIGGEIIAGDSKAPSFIYFGGALHRVPMGPAGLIMTDVLSFGAKLRLLTEPFRRARKPAEEESVYSFFARRLGAQLATRLVAPFISGIYAGDSRSLSIQAAFPGLAALERDHGSIIKGAFKELTKAKKAGAAASASDASDPRQRQTGAPGREKRKRPPRLASFREGMSFLPLELARSLGEDFIAGCNDIRLSIPSVDSPVTAGDSTGLGDSGQVQRKLRVEYSGDQRLESILCHRVVIGTPAWAASDLVRPLSGELSTLLTEIAYPRLAVVSLSYADGAAG